MSRRKPIVKGVSEALPGLQDVVGQIEKPRTEEERALRKGGRRMTEIELLRVEAYKEGEARGFNEGYDEGYDVGLREGEKSIRSRHEKDLTDTVDRFASELDDTCSAVLSAIQEWFAKMEVELSKVALQVASDIVCQEVELHPEVVQSIVRRAMEQVTHSKSARIRVNPYQSEFVRKYAPRIHAIAPSLEHVEIVDDVTLTGGVVIETEGGVVDASIDTAIKTLGHLTIHDRRSA